MQEAVIDRWVQVAVNGEAKVLRVSELRDRPYLVLLGEPGIGKSSVLRKVATDEGGVVVTCREVMNGTSLAGQSTAYLDALDEYRTTGDRKDKLHQLATAISAIPGLRWRLACRAEDWRDAADLATVRRVAQGSEIVVAHLLPLDEDEATAVLVALGEADPTEFIRQARRRAAEAFLESPLSLRLLRSALVGTGGEWPATRFELYTMAIEKLAYEWDEQRATDPRPTPSRIIEVAGILSLYMLVTSARGLWRSNAAAPMGVGDLVSVLELPVDRKVANSVLDTALFRGEGRTFEPFHRTVAEFLAAGALARAVQGGGGRPAYPLSRALALIAAPDDRAPSELRGLYAWFAAHLAKLGDEEGSLRLIKADAATVLAYGDAAAFSSKARRDLLFSLHQDDPFFQSSIRSRSMALGGLADEDLVDDFTAILTGPATNNDLLATVYGALMDGPVLPRLETTLRSIAFDPGKPMWQRWRAAEIVARYASDPASSRRSMLGDLKGMPINRDQVAMRARMMADLPKGEISVGDIREFISDFVNLPSSKRHGEVGTGDIYRLGRVLREHPLPELFDERVFPSLKGKKNDQGHPYGLRSLINGSLAAAIRATPDLSATRLRTWLGNAREHAWQNNDNDVGKAVGDWLDEPGQHRDVELFKDLLLNDNPAEGPWMVVHRFVSLTGREPGPRVFAFILAEALAAKRATPRKRLMAIAAHTAQSRSVGPQAPWRMFEVLRHEPGCKKLVQMFVSCPLRGWRIREIRRRAAEAKRNDKAKKANVQKLKSALPRIANGEPGEFGALLWGADRYFYGLADDRGDPMQAIEEFSDGPTTAAIAEGLVRFAIRGEIGVDAVALGRAEAENKGFNVEIAVAAGVHRAIHGAGVEQLASVPLDVALVALRQHWRDNKSEPSIEEWALNRLGGDPAAGASTLLQYWNAALNAGDEDLDGSHYLRNGPRCELVRHALPQLLQARPDLPPQALASAIHLVVVHAPEQLSQLAASAHRSNTLGAEALSTWTFVSLALDPNAVLGIVDEDILRTSLRAPDDELEKLLQEMSADPLKLDATRARLLGAGTAPDPDDWHQSSSISGAVRGAISRLGGSSDVTAGNYLRELLIDASLVEWKANIQHALSEHQRLRRDLEFQKPTIGHISEALAGRKPANPSDLRAISVEELRRYRFTLRTHSDTPWKSFWNTDQHGKVTQPRIENECRDRLFELLRVRMEAYGVTAVMPEARRGENTRADVLMLSHAGMNLPIEAKRGHNDELWTAPDKQLRGVRSRRTRSRFRHLSRVLVRKRVRPSGPSGQRPGSYHGGSLGETVGGGPAGRSQRHHRHRGPRCLAAARG
jgi:hypothetical protein